LGKRKQQTNNQKQSIFFRLPPEIQDIIYEEILIAPVPIHIAYVGTKIRNFRTFLCQISEEPEEQRRETDHQSKPEISHYLCSPRIRLYGNEADAHTPAEIKLQARVIGLLTSCRKM
jgi:hypothetical protein